MWLGSYVAMRLAKGLAATYRLGCVWGCLLFRQMGGYLARWLAGYVCNWLIPCDWLAGWLLNRRLASRLTSYGGWLWLPGDAASWLCGSMAIAAQLVGYVASYEVD